MFRPQIADLVLITETKGDGAPDREEDWTLYRHLKAEGLSIAVFPAVEFLETKNQWPAAILKSAGNLANFSRDSKLLVRRLEESASLHFNTIEEIRSSFKADWMADLSEKRLPVTLTRIYDANKIIAQLEKLTETFETDTLILSAAQDRHLRKTTSIDREMSNEQIQKAVNEIQSDRIRVQPYIEKWESEGPLHLIFIEGIFSHAVFQNKQRSAPSRALETAHRVLEIFEEPPLMAEFQMADRSGGRYTVHHLELSEPRLFLDLHEEASERLASAISKNI